MKTLTALLLPKNFTKICCIKLLSFWWSIFIRQNVYTMKKKILALLISGIMLSISASAQTVKDNIDKAIKDKNAKENSAKADVLIQKKTIADSTTTKITPAKVVSKTTAVNSVNKVKYKKHKYKKKRKTS